MEHKKIIILLITINLILVLNTFMNPNQLIECDYEKKLEPLSYSFSQSLLINSKSIPDVSVINLKNERLNLLDVIKHKKSIIIMHSELSCNACVDSLMTGCNSIAFQHSNIKVMGITSSKKLSYVRKFARINNLGFPLFWDQDKIILKSFNFKILPTILLVDEKGIIVQSFNIFPEIKEYNSFYFSVIQNFIKN